MLAGFAASKDQSIYLAKSSEPWNGWALNAVSLHYVTFQYGYFNPQRA